MRKIPVILLLAFFAMPAIYGQIKIGDNPQAISPTSVLELESNDRVLVITRINTAQMNAIVPNQGAMVYNTDTHCIHYFNGGEWINLCNSAGLVFTTDPIENDVSTIVITDQAGTKNFEVAPNSIGSLQIINGGINGVDIQNGSIGPGKLQNQSVTQEKLSENSVGAFALDNANIDLGDFSNGPGFITGADIVSGDAGNNISVGGDNGAFYDNQPVLDAIGINTTDIQNHIAADADTNINNEIQTLSFNGGTNELTLTNPSGDNVITLPNGGNPTDELTDLNFNGTTNILTLTNPATAGNQVDLSSLAGGAADGVVSNVVYSAADNNLTFTGVNGGFNGVINLDDLDGGGSQNLTNVLTQGNDAGTNKIIGLGAPTNPNDAATKAYVDANGGNQDLAQVLAQGTDGGAALIKNILDPVDPQDAATRAYVLATVASGGALTDGSILIGGAGDVAQQLTVGGDASLSNAGILTINPAVITLDKLNQNGAGDGQIMKWNNTAGAWEIADDDTGTATLTDGNIFVGGAGDVPQDVLMSGDAVIDNTGDLTIQDDAIELNMIAQNLANDGDVLRWDDTAGEWIVEAAPGEHTGTANSIFFADKDPANLGRPTTADDNSFANDDGGLLWDPEGRRVGGTGFGALYVGLDGFVPSTVSKAHISDNFPGFAYALHLQNHNADVVGRTTGILFSANPGDYGKGALIYERLLSEGRGDFHFLQDDAADTDRADINDIAFTIKNNKDIRLYGGIDVDGTPTGLGLNNQVLASAGPGNGVKWITGGAGETNTAANIGTMGVGPYTSKSAAELQFKNINGLDADIITVTDDAVNNEIDLDIRDESIDPTTKIVPESGGPANDKMLITDTSGNVVWDDVPTGIGNLATDNLTQDAEPRTYNMSGQTLSFFNGRIGVGPGALDADPDVALHVLGNGQVRAASFKVANGTVNLPSYRFTNDLNSGMFLPVQDELGFSANGAEAIRIDASQNVGIGTTTPTQRLHVVGNFQLDGGLIASNGAGAVNEVLTRTAAGTEWQPTGSLPAGGTNGQILSTNGAATPTYSWIDDDDNQEANDIDYNNGTSGLTGILVQDAVDELATNRIIAKGRITSAGVAGAYTETVAGGIPTGAIINLTVQEFGAFPIIIQLTNQTTTDFSIQIYQWDMVAGNFVGTNAVWHYIILNP